MKRGQISHWYQELGGPPQPGPALDRDIRVDICIVGAGYTGLWSAYYLKQADPTLKIAIVEKHFAGFGASGRNGGWLSGNFAWAHEKYLSSGSEAQLRQMVQVFHDTVGEVIDVANTHGIDADIRPTSEITVATNIAQQARIEPDLANVRRWGDTWTHAKTSAEIQARVNIPNIHGGAISDGVARIQPAKLVRGLARLVRNLGVEIYENTPAEKIEKGCVTTPKARVTCKHIIRATEGFTATLPGQKRAWLPLNSAQIITEPLPQSVWDEIGWDGYEVVGDYANAYCYCQRTDDGRIAVGGRGIPYQFGSNIDQNGVPQDKTVAELQVILDRLFPAAAPIPLAHAWQGVLGVPRDWCATVGMDADTNIGWAGGYVGIGLTSSNVAGRTLRDLTMGNNSTLTQLPWVNRRVRKWEPEPLRYIAVHGMYKLLKAADRFEAKSGKVASPLSKIGNWVKGL